MKLSDYQAKFNKIQNENLPSQVEIDDIGNTIPATQYRAEQLKSLSVEIRRCAWQAGAKEIANDLAEQCDKVAANLGASRQPLPRFDGFVSGGIVYKPIK